MPIDNLERVSRSDKEIIDKLISDTKRNAIHWYNTTDMIYCKIGKQIGNNLIFIIFKISDQMVEEYPYNKFDFDQSSSDVNDTVIVLDIYISKSNKREIFCKRIQDYQLKLINLIDTIIPAMKRPKQQ